MPNLNTHTAYIPPHPQRGTAYHRYTVLLLPQQSHISIPMVAKDKRTNFSVRAFTEQYGLDANAGGGAHMWREVWSEGVPVVYKDILSEMVQIFFHNLSSCDCRNCGAEVWEDAQSRQVWRFQGQEAICVSDFPNHSWFAIVW